MSVSKLGKMGLIFINAGVNIKWRILSWHASVWLKSYCLQWVRLVPCSLSYLPTMPCSCCCSLSVRDNQPSGTTDTCFFHQTFGHPTAQIRTDLTTKYGEKCSSRSTNSGVASYGVLGYVPTSTSNNFIFSSLWSKSDSQLSKCCVVCKISWCRCQQLTDLS